VGGHAINSNCQSEFAGKVPTTAISAGRILVYPMTSESAADRRIAPSLLRRLAHDGRGPFDSLHVEDLATFCLRPRSVSPCVHSIPDAPSKTSNRKMAYRLNLPCSTTRAPAHKKPSSNRGGRRRAIRSSPCSPAGAECRPEIDRTAAKSSRAANRQVGVPPD
jgi:hypothetical protein